MQTGLFPRAVERLLRSELLVEFPALLVVGARGCGKSTSMAHFADTVLDLSVPGVRLAALEDPDGLLQSASGRVLIDEWQEAPEILGAVKRSIDTHPNKTNGRFLITGSVRAARQATTWPGTGRFIRARMFGLTQGEMSFDDRYNPVDQLFASQGSVLYQRSDVARLSYVERIVSGRFPQVVSLSTRARSRWFDAYVEQLVDRDAVQLSPTTTHPRILRAVLNSCAARTAGELNREATARDADVDRRTAERYIQLLEDLSIVFRVPAWHDKRLARLNRSPKIHMSDPGMAAHLLYADEQTLTRDATLIGQLFETFVAAELRTYVETAHERTEMFHARDRDGHEVDLVFERRGQIVALEVKSSTTVSSPDAKGIRWIRDQVGDRFQFGAVLYAGEVPFRLDHDIWALPISYLWQAPEAAF